MPNLDLEIVKIMHGDTPTLKIMQGDTKVWPSGNIAIIDCVLANVTSSVALPGRTALGESFTTTLTPSTGYTLDSVTVTMDGVDVTSSSYDNGVITIAEVTGDIVISATAVMIITPTTSTAYSGYYVRITDGAVITNSSYNITNPIDVLAGDTVIAHCKGGSGRSNAVISKYNEGANYTPLVQSDADSTAKDWTYIADEDCKLSFSYVKKSGGTISVTIRRA